jgi:mannose/cellobiose epimerase-like protein (N-acyl-D-glucosamine 2-epimerase family)
VRFAEGTPVPQSRDDQIFTYSDAFVAKGLVAGAARYAPDDLDRQLDYLDRVIASIETRRFQMDEAVPLSTETASGQAPDFGPRMILLGAAELLAPLGRPDRLAFAGRFIEHVLANHFDPKSGLLANVPGEDACNVGHAIEFAGFAMAWMGADAPRSLAATLESILVASFERGFTGPGIALSVSIGSGAVLNPLCPWWSLPETIRTAALCHAYSRSEATLQIWRQAHEAFFGSYWRGRPAIACQTMGPGGPVDFVPATPDLDPGYHTGLSLLAAIDAFG